MWKAMRFVGLGTLTVAGTLALSGGPAMAAPPIPAPMAYTCSGGDLATGTFVHIKSGTYASITVTGACDVAPDAVINVVGNLNVAAGAAFDPGGVIDLQSAPSTITVGHNVIAAAGSILSLGCLPNPTGHTTGHPCAIEPTKSSNITVDGNLTATNADTVSLNGITVNGNVVLTGGGEDVNVWPIKMNTIGGNLIVSGMTPNWLGVVDNQIGGNAILNNITITDPGDPHPTIFITINTIGHNLICSGLGPNVFAGGGIPGEANVVGHNAIGQCAQ